jgi:hypothetical protein
MSAAPLGAGLPEPGKTSAEDPRGMEPIIRAAAIKHGIDPDVAMRVARSEGLRDFLGDKGKSGGAFQLYTGGGLGNEFQQETHLNPLDPKNEAATIDYAMQRAREKGWGPWYGAAKVGVGRREGIGREPMVPGGPGFGGAAPMPGETPKNVPDEVKKLSPYTQGNALPGGESPISGLHPEMLSRLNTAIEAMPPELRKKFQIYSGYRSEARQARVHPGVTHSHHTGAGEGAGLAVDTSTDPEVLKWSHSIPNMALATH